MLGLSANALGETRRLEIEIEPIIMLSCVDTVNYTIDTTTLLSLGRRVSSAARTTATSDAARKIEASLSMTDLLGEDDDSLITIDVNDACSLRGLGRGEGFLVTVSAADDGTLVNAEGTGVLSVKDARARPGYGGGYAQRFAIPQSRIRLDTPIDLDVQLRVDMRLANGSGQYSSKVDGVFSIEVSAP
jgi:hypothetical protein